LTDCAKIGYWKWLSEGIKNRLSFDNPFTKENLENFFIIYGFFSWFVHLFIGFAIYIGFPSLWLFISIGVIVSSFFATSYSIYLCDEGDC